MAHILDSSRLVFQIRPDNDCPSFGFVDKSNSDLLLLDRFGHERLASLWSPVRYRSFHPKKAKQAKKTSDLEVIVASVMVRAEFADELCEGFRDMVEFLPVTVDDVPWLQMHFFEWRGVLDEKHSHFTPPPTPHPWERYWLIHRVVLQDDPRLYSAFFTIRDTGTAKVYCGAGFRDRVQRMGLVGLTFNEIGYFHRPGDPEPPAPEPYFPERKPIELPPPIWQASGLVEQSRDALTEARKATCLRLGLASDAAEQAVLDALKREIVGLRPGYSKLNSDARQQTLLGLAALYGSLYVERLNWNWSELSGPDRAVYLAITTPDLSHFIPVSAVVDALLANKRRDITLALTFNMARAGSLPPSLPGALVQLG